MEHIVFNRPLMRATYYDDDGQVLLQFDASGDTWGNYGASDDGNPPQPPYGHCCSIAPGHYELGTVDDNGAYCVSEGHYQINVADLSDATKAALVTAGKCVPNYEYGTLNIGGISLARGGLARYGRSAVMIHGGGTNLGAHALDDYQTLLRTWGCTRVHNADLAKLAQLVNSAHASGHVVIFSVIGDVKPVPG